MAQAAQLTPNQELLTNSSEMFWAMPPSAISTAPQVIDVELDSLAGFMDSIDFDVFLDIAITAAGSAVAPTLSQFAPYNFFSKMEIQIGGGAFVSVMPYFFYLRDLITHRGWSPGQSALTQVYSTSTHYVIPTITAASSAVTDNYFRFPIHIPLQAIPKQAWGHIPLGTSAVKCKVRFTVTSTLLGTDQYACPLNGGTNITSVTIGTTKPSYVAPNINYKMPNSQGVIPNIGWILNVQERAFNIVGAGSNTPLKFPDPYQYMRLWMIFIDGTGAPNTTGIQSLEIDPIPGFPRQLYNSASSLAAYFAKIQRLYETNLPTGVFCFDLNTDVNPVTGDGNQNINGVNYQTLQTQIATTAATNVASPARIITYAETFQPVTF